ncbi:hypothetical protein ACFW9D_10395 [Streptomyces sp. NPDC059524]|uniref:hypothetical protein n=1 Tax=Streptomyces sp. NPDC059524 TaxID=3346856 RepID=UPI0036AAB7C6
MRAACVSRPGRVQGVVVNAQDRQASGWPEYRRYLDHLMDCAECARLPKRCAVGERLRREHRAAGRGQGSAS